MPLPAVEKASLSLTETAYATLRADILACRLPPGRKLKINELCTTLGVSLGAVREALSRLAAEGFVVSEAQRGFAVAPVSAEDLKDLTEIRSEIEASCLRRAISLGGVDWETGIVAAFHRLSRTPERVAGDERRLSDDWAANHAAFHLALVQACDSPWLLRLRAMLYAQSERYRRLSVPLAHKDRNLTDEHRALMDAALRRDGDTAVNLMTKHLATTSALVLDLAQEPATEQAGTTSLRPPTGARARICSSE